ncbi:metallophosphoesterase [Gorillibacterium sp. CAU 1737]|uniref:metallophosphoesterase n=1 Tax=Gorillibacterium sp. CAU 1737 TaxID=3140362 RepID=UPI0032616E0B
MKKWRIPITVLALLLAVLAFSYSQNNWLTTTRFSVASDKLPGSFDGYRIVQLSDLHGKTFGYQQRPLLNKVRRAKPDLIVFTGDMIDSDTPGDRSRSLTLMKGLTAVAPVYWVTGNHELSPNLDSLKQELTDVGVHVLANRGVPIEQGGERIWLSGIDDPRLGSSSGSLDTEVIVNEHMEQAIQDRPQGLYTILLSHRPEIFDFYVRKGFDLILTGHAHGGQIRLPFLGPLYAPDQGFSPQLTEGAHKREGSVMIVNRGLGNSVIPQRLLNRPEIVVVTLQAKPSSP